MLMKRVFRNWFASFATIFIVEMLYLGMAGQNSGTPSVYYALQSSRIFAVLGALSFVGYAISSKNEKKTSIQTI